MPPKTRKGWKTGEQLEFLLAHWDSFKRAQDGKTLDRFWPKVCEEWFHRWPVPSSPTLALEHGTIEEGRLMLQKEKTTQIKHWFNNRCRTADAVNGSRGDLKLDFNRKKRKLAPVQAYCSYAWDSTLCDIVLTRWKQEKNSVTFDDDEDPVEEDGGTSEESRIPLAFKLKIAKQFYDGLTKGEKDAIDIRRERDRDNLYRKVIEIEDNGERHEKLRFHQKNQPFIAKSLNRVLENLEDQTGCVAQLLVAWVGPGGTNPSIQKFCQGSTQHGLGFETFYGDEWEERVENKFREWAVWSFGERGTERRNMYLLPKSSATPSETPSTGPESQPTETSSSGSQDSTTEATPSQRPTPQASKSQTPTSQPSSSKKSTAQPSKSQKTASRPSKSQKSVPQPSAPKEPVSRPSVATPTPSDVPNFDEDAALLTTVIGVHQLLSQVTVNPQVTDSSSFETSGSPITVEPSQLTIKPSQVIVEPSQLSIEPPQTVTGLLQNVPGYSNVSTEVVPMDTQPDSIIAPIPSQLPTTVANAASNNPKPRYRIRTRTATPSEKPASRSSIDGAPAMVIDAIDEGQEVVVDLRDYLNMESDNETHVSSSQKSSDGFGDLTIPPPDLQQEHATTGRTEGNISRSGFAPTRTHPQLDIEERDLPAWMVKKHQWRYVASTAGGAAWENLLNVYMSQERRLEFGEVVMKVMPLTNQDRPSKISEYFQYAHQPSRGDTLTTPDFGAEVVKWWQRIQPEWRRSKQDLPESSTEWSYILSGGSKGAFLIILCLAWWDRAYQRYLEKQREVFQARAKVTRVAANPADLPDHDADWLNIVNDVAFVMQKARDCGIPTQGMPSPRRKEKRKYQEEPQPQLRAARSSSRKKSKA